MPHRTLHAPLSIAITVIAGCLTPANALAMNDVNALGHFVVLAATAGNTSGHQVFLDHPLTDGNPQAICFVTQNFGPGGGTYNDHNEALAYDGVTGRWSIINQDLAAVPLGADFNILIPAGSAEALVHTATAGNIVGNSTAIDHPLLNGNPNAVIIATANYNPGGGAGVYNDHAIGVSYDGAQWNVVNQDLAAMTDGASFNILIEGIGAPTFVHEASTFNVFGNWSEIDHPLTTGNPNAVVVVTPNYNPGGGAGVYNDHTIGVRYDGMRWAVFNQDIAPMTLGTSFNVAVLARHSELDVHTTSGLNIEGSRTYLDAPFAFDNAAAALQVTSNWGALDGVYNDHNEATWYGGAVAALCTAEERQTRVRAASDGAGGAYVAWWDYRSGAGETDIYAHHILPTGAPDPMWPVDGLPVCTAPMGQSYVAIMSDGAGGALLSWPDDRADPKRDIYAHRLVPTGLDPAWPVNGSPVISGVLWHEFPTMTTDGAGGAIVAWRDIRVAEQYDIYAQRILSTGALHPGWPVTGLPVCTEPGRQDHPRIVSDGTGGAVVMWQDERSGAADIYAQRILGAGVIAAGWPINGRAICTAAGDQEYLLSVDPIVSDGAGGAIIAWEDYRDGPSTDIYAQRVLASGTVDPAWPVNGRAICTESGDQLRLEVASDGAGGAIIVWHDERTGVVFGEDIYAQHVLPSGSIDPAWPAGGLAISTAYDTQSDPAIVSDGSGGAIIVWQDFRYSRFQQRIDIYGHHVLASGELDPNVPAEGQLLSDRASQQFEIVAVPEGSGGLCMAWLERPVGGGLETYDVFGMCVQDGVIPLPWAVFNQDLVEIPDATRFNVLLPGHSSVNWVHEAEPGNSFGNVTLLDHPATTGKPNAVVFATQNATPLGLVGMTNDASIGVWYTGLEWSVFNQNFATLPVGSAYNILVCNAEDDAVFVHTATPSNITSNWTEIDNPLTNGNPEARLTVTQNWNPGGIGGVYNDHAIGVWYTGARWAIFNQDLAPMTDGASFNVLVDAAPNLVAVDGPGEVGKTFTLNGSFPNPAAGTTYVRFVLPEAAAVSLRLYDVSGRALRTVLDGHFHAGSHQAALDLGGLPSGKYFYRLEARPVSGPPLIETRALVLTR